MTGATDLRRARDAAARRPPAVGPGRVSVTRADRRPVRSRSVPRARHRRQRGVDDDRRAAPGAQRALLRARQDALVRRAARRPGRPGVSRGRLQDRPGPRRRRLPGPGRRAARAQPRPAPGRRRADRPAVRARRRRVAGLAVVEGTMGLYDSVAGRPETESTAAVAAALRARWCWWSTWPRWVSRWPRWCTASGRTTSSSGSAA